MSRIYAFDKNKNRLSSLESKAFKKLLAAETMAVKNGPTVKNQVFPLIVHHPGAGGTVVDNQVFFEYMASQGFVVCSAAYQAGEGGIYVGWNPETSIPDMDIIIETARKENYVSQELLGLMGHSVGGDMCLAYIAKGKYKANAFITLDANFGYCEDYTCKRGAELVQLFWANLDNYTVPMLNTVHRAYFPVLDSLIHCSRTYMQIDQLGHEEFTSLGVIGRRAKYDQDDETLFYKRVD